MVLEESDDNPPTDPSRYELVIDNDSGTYRPNAAMLPVLASYLAECLPGLHIQTLDCQVDADKMAKMKTEQRERKKREGDNIIYAQGDASSISSSEDERLDEIEAGLDGGDDPHRQHVATGGGHGEEHGHLEQVAKDIMHLHTEKANRLQKVASPRES